MLNIVVSAPTLAASRRRFASPISSLPKHRPHRLRERRVAARCIIAGSAHLAAALRCGEAKLDPHTVARARCGSGWFSVGEQDGRGFLARGGWLRWGVGEEIGRVV